MPYIIERRRAQAGCDPENVGELCYQLYRDMLRYADGARAFNRFAEVLGAVEAAKMEYYRRVVAPYEDVKIVENGDVV